MRTWLDNFLTVPAVGLRLKPNFKAAFRFSEIGLGAIQQHFPDADIKVATSAPFVMTANLSDGFIFEFSHDNIVVKFQYRYNLASKGGELPVQLEEHDIRPFSELLENVIDRIRKVVAPIVELGEISVIRAGILADCNLNTDALPPGAQDFFDRLESIWRGPLKLSDTTLLTVLEENEESLDQCHHIIKFDHDQHPDEVFLKIDWQRVFKKPLQLKQGVLEREILNWLEHAQNYFLEVGEGISEVK